MVYRRAAANREMGTTATGGDKDLGAGSAGRVKGRRTPWAEAGQDSPGRGGSAADGVALR